MQTLDDYSAGNLSSFRQSFETKRGKGVKVEELINKFKNDANFDTMGKRPHSRKSGEAASNLERRKSENALLSFRHHDANSPRIKT